MNRRVRLGQAAGGLLGVALLLAALPNVSARAQSLSVPYSRQTVDI